MQLRLRPPAHPRARSRARDLRAAATDHGIRSLLITTSMTLLASPAAAYGDSYVMMERQQIER